RASTPTDAAKRIVPDVTEERQRVVQARQRIRSAMTALVTRQQQGLDSVRSRPVLARPLTMVQARETEVAQHLRHARHLLDAALLRGSGEIGRLAAQVRALSPASTLDRGYAVVQRSDRSVVRAADDVAVGDPVHVRIAAGALDATVTHAEVEQPASR